MLFILALVCVTSAWAAVAFARTGCMVTGLPAHGAARATTRPVRCGGAAVHKSWRARCWLAAPERTRGPRHHRCFLASPLSCDVPFARCLPPSLALRNTFATFACLRYMKPEPDIASHMLPNYFRTSAATISGNEKLGLAGQTRVNIDPIG